MTATLHLVSKPFGQHASLFRGPLCGHGERYCYPRPGGCFFKKCYTVSFVLPFQTPTTSLRLANLGTGELRPLPIFHPDSAY